MSTALYSQQQTLIQNLCSSENNFPHSVKQLERIETHISTVILCGEFAYKIKKPVNFGFLDFTSLEQRRHFCEEELRLNRRLAPDLYLDVVALRGSIDAPHFGSEGEIIEYAVKMRQFSQQDLLDKQLAKGNLNGSQMDALATDVQRFHQQVAIADESSTLGTAEEVFAPMQQNFDQLYPLIKEPDAVAQLKRLEQWSQQHYQQLKPLLQERKLKGFIRECHGDMHLGNMTLQDDKISLFDGIEFNESFRWIDVISEIAFLIMDLDDRKAPKLARRFLNAYLEQSGDYQGLQLLRFYQVYRALVRAKIASFRLAQEGLSDTEQQQAMAQYRSYTDLAETYTSAKKPHLCATHGLSGSGKSHLSQQAVEQYGFIRLRSDLERKRLFGLETHQNSNSSLNDDLYSSEATTKTYQHLQDLSELVLTSGFSPLIDATLLDPAQRAGFKQLAHDNSIAFVLLDIHADETLLKQRIKARQEKGNDASEADLQVLQQQIKKYQALQPDEADQIINIDNQEGYVLQLAFMD
ncbi:MAG: AAA family ATPase [Gammaproteobacteria bacterium]|nr:AAA family ATPase [Gammaproteobacteria bacterium]